MLIDGTLAAKGCPQPRRCISAPRGIGESLTRARGRSRPCRWCRWRSAALPGSSPRLGRKQRHFSNSSSGRGLQSPALLAAPHPQRPSSPGAPPAAAPARPALRATDVAKPKGFVQTPILSVIAESPDIKTFRLARPEGLSPRPGQFLTVRGSATTARTWCAATRPPGAAAARPASRSTCASRSGLECTACPRPPGQRAERAAPAGAFTYPGGDDSPLVLFGGGIGITPLISMLRHALLTEPTSAVIAALLGEGDGRVRVSRRRSTLTRRHDQLQVCFVDARAWRRPTFTRAASTRSSCCRRCPTSARPCR